MDERIKQGYHKIYSELYLILFVLTAVSMIVNGVFLNKDVTQLWLEYIILVGSPIYRLVRIKMLGIADPPAAGWKKVIGIRLGFAVAVLVLLLSAAIYFQGGTTDIHRMFVFLIPFTAMFLLVAFGTKKLQEFWKRQQEEKYEDKQ